MQLHSSDDVQKRTLQVLAFDPNGKLPSRGAVVFVCLLAFTILYFADVVLRASEKYFWPDEIVTLYLARLNPPALWQALTTGADQNPPPFYWLTRIGELVGGENRIGLRLPEMVGFWIFCLCIFRFVQRYAGVIAGLIAMVFPMFTGAFYYTCDARPHAVTLGFAGLAIIFWQMAQEGSRRPVWLIALGAALLGAMLMHCYALTLLAPFAVAEMYCTIAARRANVYGWAALLLPTLLVAPVYVPIFRGFQHLIAGTNYGALNRATMPQVGQFFLFLLSPAFFYLALALLFLSLASARSVRAGLVRPSAAAVLALAFLSLPAFGVLMAQGIHSPFFVRYFLSALVGVCFCLGLLFQSTDYGKLNNAALAFAFLLWCGAAASFTRVVWHRLHGYGEAVLEPTSGYVVDTTPGDPLDNESVIRLAAEDVPILIRDVLTFEYLTHYDAAQLRRLYFVDNPGEQPRFSLLAYRKWGPPFNAPDDLKNFLESHTRVYFFGRQSVFDQIPFMLERGWQLRALKSSGGENLALFERVSQNNR